MRDGAAGELYLVRAWNCLLGDLAARLRDDLPLQVPTPLNQHFVSQRQSRKKLEIQTEMWSAHSCDETALLLRKTAQEHLKRSRYHRDNLVIFTIETLDHENGSESGPKIALEMRMKSWDTIYDVARCETVSFSPLFVSFVLLSFPHVFDWPEPVLAKHEVIVAMENISFCSFLQGGGAAGGHSDA